MDEPESQNKFAVLPWILLLIVIVAGFFFYKSRQDAKMKAAEEQTMMMQKDKEKKAMEEKAKNTITVTLAPQNKSDQSGTATISEENGKVKVMLDLTGGNFTKPQPAHFHEGTCEKPGKVVYPLKNAENGKSTTVLDVSLAKLKSQAPLVINVHKSDAEISVYTACGTFK